MTEEQKETQYFSRDFEWAGLRDEVERDPSFGYHLSPIPTSLSAPTPGGAHAEAWRTFHRRHSAGKFFKERRYLLKEFPDLIVSNGSFSLLEVGCGSGSTVLPILRSKKNIIVYACDCSQNALDKAGEIVASANLAFRDRFYPFFHEISVNRFPDWLLCSVCQNVSPRKKYIFTPDADEQSLIRLNKPTCLEECISVLKPGGLLLFRDYGLFDMAMLRFRPEQKVGFKEYMRSDGTLSYFFSLDVVRNLFLGAGFIELELEYCCVISVNHRSGKKMRRVWVHGKFQKPGLATS